MAKRKPKASAKGRQKASTAQETKIRRQIQDAVDRARDWLAERGDYYGFMSRRDTSRGAPELARHLQGDLLAKQGRNGSWAEGDLAATAEALWRLLELGMPAGSPALTRGLDWLYRCRDVEGAYGSGCAPSRHEQRLCEHFIRGFFSPGPTDEGQEITLPNGQSVTSDAGARLLMSERALRSALRANPSDPRATPSLSGLRSLPLYLEYGGSHTPALLVGAIQALAWANPGHDGELSAGLEALSTAQAKDGSWPNVEFFFVLETLLEVRTPAAERMLKKATARLLETQHKYGAWGRRHLAAQTWIAVQVLDRQLAI